MSEPVAMQMDTTPQEDPSKQPTPGGEDFNMEARRRLKNEARLSSGIGKAKEKERNLDIFWNRVWPKLEQAGWTKHEGSGAQTGSVTFLPKGSVLSERGAVSSGDSYDRIRDVMDRLEEGRSQTEAAIANMYRSLQEGSKATGGTPSRVFRPRNIMSPHHVDLSWKDGGRNFPRKSSKVGEEYQVATLPEAGTFDPREHGEPTLMWDPKKAADLINEEGELSLLNDVPTEKREGALELIVLRDYVPGDDFVQSAAALSSRNGSDWPPEKKLKYSECVFNFRKDLNSVKASMEIDMCTCLAHYYGVFKHTDDYRLVKTVLHDEKMDARKAALMANVTATGSPATNVAVVGDPDACVVCDDGGELLICDGCEGEYHMECMDPPLKAVPEGHWECDECVNQKLLTYRDYLVRQSGLFETKDPEQEEGPVIFKPTPSAMASIQKMAKGISKILSPDDEDQDVTMKDVIKEESGSGHKRKADEQ